MTSKQLAEQYMACFYGEAPLASMRAFLADDLIFEGPMFRFNSADAYMQSLLKEPSNASYELVYQFQTKDSVCFVYKFFKQELETLMSQTFECVEGKIQKIVLIFDSAVFK